MGIIDHHLTAVISNFPVPASIRASIRVEPTPETEHRPTWTGDLYEPTAEDLAYDTGFVMGREGVGCCDHRCPPDWHRDGRAIRFAEGRQAGRKDRERRAARELGAAMFEHGISEPPAGLNGHEAEAYREGFAWAQEEYDAWLDGRFCEYDAYRDSEPREADGFAAGYYS